VLHIYQKCLEIVIYHNLVWFKTLFRWRICQHNPILGKSGNNKGHFTWRPTCILVSMTGQGIPNHGISGKPHSHVGNPLPWWCHHPARQVPGWTPCLWLLAAENADMTGAIHKGQRWNSGEHTRIVNTVQTYLALFAYLLSVGLFIIHISHSELPVCPHFFFALVNAVKL
jgi:hypothetical protein